MGWHNFPAITRGAGRGAGGKGYIVIALTWSIGSPDWLESYHAVAWSGARQYYSPELATALGLDGAVAPWLGLAVQGFPVTLAAPLAMK